MNRNSLVTGLIVVLAVLGYFFLEDNGAGNPSQEQVSNVVSSSDYVVPNQTIYDLDGRIAFQGDIDLAPSLARIERGETDPHENDGAIFSNREGLLPRHDRGYYREYVVRTSGINHAGPQRLILGEGGEIFYTPDHYESFVRLDQ